MNVSHFIAFTANDVEEEESVPVRSFEVTLAESCLPTVQEPEHPVEITRDRLEAEKLVHLRPFLLIDSQ